MRTTIFLGAAAMLIAGCTGGDAGGGGGVKGTVVSGFGAPLARVQVMVIGEDPVETDEDGRFETDAPDPYDLVVTDPAGTMVQVFMGVTDRSPDVVSSLNSSGGVLGSATGTLTGGSGFPAGGTINHNALFVQDGAEWFGTSGLSVDSDTGAFDATINWAQVPAATGRVSVLQYDSSTGIPAAYTGFGAVSGVSLEKGATTANVDIALTDVPEGSVSGTVTLPEGFVVQRYRMQLFELIDGRQFFRQQFQGPATTSTSFSFATPAGDFWVTAVVLARHTETGRGARVNAYTGPTTAGLVLDVPPLIEAITPAEEAESMSLAAPISWQPVAHDVTYSVILNSLQGGVLGDTVPVLEIHTDATSVTLPDLSPLGISYGTGTRSLQIGANDLVTSVDGFLVREFGVPETATKHIYPAVVRQIEVTP